MMKGTIFTVLLLLGSTFAQTQARTLSQASEQPLVNSPALKATSSQIDQSKPPEISAGSHQRLPQPNWNLKYSSGPLALKKDQWLKAAFIHDPATIQGTTPAVAIPIDELREIFFEPQAEKDSDTMQHMPRSGCGYAKDLMPKNNSARVSGTFVAWAISPGAMKRTVEHLNARYPIRFAWSDKGAEKELTFSVRSCEYASFLANLRWIVGQRWKDIEHKFPQ